MTPLEQSSLSQRPQAGVSRRDFLCRAARAAAAGALAAGAWRGAAKPAIVQAGEPAEPDMPLPKGRAEACIFLWLGGGACHIDTWDPKRKGNGRDQPGSYYDAIDTATSGVQVCQHLARTARVLDRLAIVRTLHHDVVDEHAAATNRLHTGRPTSGTILYPSIGSVVSHELGAGGDAVPRYVVMGYPNVTRGPGFLGPKHGYLYLTETATGPNGLVLPPDVTAERQARREALLGRMRQGALDRHRGQRRVEEYAALSAEAFKLAGKGFSRLFELHEEPAALRESYGGEFGQRCLLARRLVEGGVRFIEVASNLNFINGTGWDTHNEGQLKQHELIDELDRALSTLIVDLETRRLLDRTLIVVATEFGRPPEFDGGGGRGHHSAAFSAVLAGGGLRTGQVVGETDELGRAAVSRAVSIPDLHATIYCALGIDPGKELYDGNRPVPITDMGRPLRELFAAS